MKIYHLIQNDNKSRHSLLKLVTYPENPDSDLDVYFRDTEKSTILNKDIYIYISGLIHSKIIGVSLAKEIIADYPHLFKNKEIEVESEIKASRKNLFGHLNAHIKTHAEKNLEELNEKIAANAKYPIVIKYQIARAELFVNSNHFDIAKEEYEKLSQSYKEQNYYATKIQEGINRCKQELKKNELVIQTPFRISFEALEATIERKMPPVTSSPTLFANVAQTSKLDKLQEELFFHIVNYLEGKDKDNLWLLNKATLLKKYRWDLKKLPSQHTENSAKISYLEKTNFFSNSFLASILKKNSKHQSSPITNEDRTILSDENTINETTTLSSLIIKNHENKTILFSLRENQRALNKVFNLFKDTSLPHNLGIAHLAVLCNQIDFMMSSQSTIEQDVLTQESEEGNTLLHMGAFYGYEKWIKWLLNKKVDVNLKNKLGQTPLLLAARHGHLSCLKILAANHGNIELCDGNRSTPLHWAVKNDHPGVVDFLLSLGANVLAKGTNQRIPLHVAAEMNNLTLFKVLFNHNKESFKVTDRNGNHAVHIAAEKNAQSIMMYHSVYHRDCLTLKNAYQKTSLELALLARHRPIVEVIATTPEFLSTDDYLIFDKVSKEFIIKLTLDLEESNFYGAEEATLFFKTYLLASFRQYLKTKEKEILSLTQEDLQKDYNVAMAKSVKKLIILLDAQHYDTHAKFNAVALFFRVLAHTRICDWAFSEEKTNWEALFIDYFDEKKTIAPEEIKADEFHPNIGC